MTGFQADLDAIGKFGDLVGRFSDDAATVVQYVQDHETWKGDNLGHTLDWYESRGLFAILIGKHDDYVKRAAERSGYLRSLAGKSSVGIIRTVGLYHKTGAGHRHDRRPEHPALPVRLLGWHRAGEQPEEGA